MAYCIVIQTLNKMETGVCHLWGTIGGPSPPLATRLALPGNLLSKGVVVSILVSLLSCRSPSTRFRWLQQTVALRGNIWALDNIYLGNGCAWMCSGHGYCRRGVCQ